MRKLIIGGCVTAAVILVFAFFLGVFVLNSNGTDYFTQIDNNMIKPISEHGGMHYSYTLPAYNNNGESRDLKFETSRELREDAFLKLNVVSIRGVVSWEEVDYNDLPDSVRAVFPNSDS